MIAEAHGIPLAVSLTGGNRNDITQLMPLIAAIPPVRGRHVTGPARPPSTTRQLRHNRRYGGFIVLKKENNEPLQEALALMQNQPPCEVYDDPESKEHIEFWDEDHIETLV